jgi:hypothetical protein
MLILESEIKLALAPPARYIKSDRFGAAACVQELTLLYEPVFLSSEIIRDTPAHSTKGYHYSLQS